MKYWLIMTVIAFCCSAAKCEISNLKLNNKYTSNNSIEVSFESTKSFKGRLELLSGKVLEQQKRISVKPGKNSISWELTPYLGGKRYLFKIIAGTSISKAEVNVEIPSPYEVQKVTEISKIYIESDNVKIILKQKAATDNIISVMLFIDDKLYAVDHPIIKAGKMSVGHKLSPIFQALAANRNAEIRVFATAGSNILKTRLRLTGKEINLPKPMNYGIYMDGHGNKHAWYMNHKSQYIYDGAAYFPVGGMWTAKTPGNTSQIPPAGRISDTARRVAIDNNVLDCILAYGINDIYINLGSWAKPSQIQYFVDMLEKRGVYYGWQLNTKNGGVIPSFFLTHTRKHKSTRWQNTISAVYHNGALEFSFSKEYKTIGFLIVKDDFCKVVSYEDCTGKDSRKGIDVDDGKDFNKRRSIKLKVKLPVTDGAKVSVIPYVAAGMRHADLWSESVRKEIYKKLEWLKCVKWGPRFRFFVDAVVNEQNMLNGTENLRQYSPEINSAFRKYLVKKYRSIKELNAAWISNLHDFATASRIIPVRLGKSLLLVDPETGKNFQSDLFKSQAWPDYNQMIRQSYAEMMDDIAIKIKQIVNIPVINKSVGTTAEDIQISRRYLGCDGVGLEIYLNHGCPQEASGGGAVAAVEATPHTVWEVGTEIGFSAKPGNGNQKFFPDKKTLFRLTENLYSMGCNGFFFFGIYLPGVWQPHSYYNMKDKLAWIREVDEKYSSRAPAHKSAAFIWPSGYTWWWWTDQSRALYDAPRGEIAQSLRLPDGNWAYSTLVLPETAKCVIIHIPRPPYSIRYKKQIEELIASGRKVIVVGDREDIGSIPAIDHFYTERVIRFSDGSKAKVLKKHLGVKVISEQNSMPWAIKKGNLTIISRYPVTNHQRNRNLGFLYLTSEMLK